MLKKICNAHAYFVYDCFGKMRKREKAKDMIIHFRGPGISAKKHFDRTDWMFYEIMSVTNSLARNVSF